MSRLEIASPKRAKIVMPFAALATMAGLPAGVMGVYISINTLCDMGATCVNVIGDMAGCVVLKEKIEIEK